MRFTLICSGNIPSNGDKSKKDAIRDLLQPQLEALYKVTSAAISSKNSIILQGIKYVSIIPIDWTVRIQLTLLRATATAGRVGNSDLDNVVKTLFDAISAPGGHVGQTKTTPFGATKYCVILEDNQINNYEIIEDFHWKSEPKQDIAVITVFTRETKIDHKVALGGATYEDFRHGVF